MKRRTFRITGFDEGGVRGSADNLRLVCLTKSEGKAAKVALWGKRESRRNIDAVLDAGPHCSFVADWVEPPEDFVRKFGHRFWVPENGELIIKS